MFYNKLKYINIKYCSLYTQLIYTEKTNADPMPVVFSTQNFALWKERSQLVM